MDLLLVIIFQACSIGGMANTPRIECGTKINFTVNQPPTSNISALLNHLFNGRDDLESPTCTARFDPDTDAVTGALCLRRMLSIDGITITSKCSSCLSSDIVRDSVAHAQELHNR